MARASGEVARRGEPRRVTVPTGVAVFPKELYPTSRRIAADHYAIEHWTRMPRGGHFSALEQPALLVEDLRTFFAGRR
jgi:microsomal epoxide hydrolase